MDLVVLDPAADEHEALKTSALQRSTAAALLSALSCAEVRLNDLG